MKAPVEHTDGTGAFAALAGVTPRALWARRAEWLPADIAWDTGDVTAEEALARAREHATSFAGSDVLQFIRRG